MTDTQRPHVVVTGAANGIGRAIATDLAEHGWEVTGVDMRAEALNSALDEITEKTGAPTRAIVGDLSDAGFAASFVSEAWTHAPVEGLVNAAGIYPAIPFLELEVQQWNRVQAVNVVAPLLATQTLARLAIPVERTPRVVNITSGAAQRARPGTSHYSTSKAALEMVTKATAVELGAYGIRVNAVAPGFFSVASEVNPISEEYEKFMRATLLKGPGEPRWVASAVRFLLSEDSHWMTGTSLAVDGGGSAGTNVLPMHWGGASTWQAGESQA